MLRNHGELPIPLLGEEQGFSEFGLGVAGWC